MAPRAQTESRERRRPKAERDARLEAELDRALAGTFPASDPYSVGHFTSTEPPARPVDRQAPELTPEPTEATPPRPSRRKASH
jgi:hypothetical protein